MFGCLYVRITASMGRYKTTHFDAINLYPPIRSKLSCLANEDGASLRMNAQPSNQAEGEQDYL
jgi:hypothetical protein